MELLSDHHQWHAADEDEALQGRLPRIPRAAIAAAPTRPPHHTTIDLTAADSQALQELQAPLVVPSPHTQRQRHRRPTRQHAPQQDDDESEPSAPALPQLRHPPSITPLPKHVAVRACDRHTALCRSRPQTPRDRHCVPALPPPSARRISARRLSRW